MLRVLVLLLLSGCTVVEDSGIDLPFVDIGHDLQCTVTAICDGAVSEDRSEVCVAPGSEQDYSNAIWEDCMQIPGCAVRSCVVSCSGEGYCQL